MEMIYIKNECGAECIHAYENKSTQITRQGVKGLERLNKTYTKEYVTARPPLIDVYIKVALKKDGQPPKQIGHTSI